jgi:hypothetical protein
MLKSLSAPRAAAFLGAIAIVSALFSNFLTFFPNTDDFPTLFGAPLLPAIYFGIAIGIGVHLWEKQGAIPLALVMIGIIISWTLAWRTAISVSDFLQQYPGADGRKFPFALAIAGMVAGLVGSLGTVISVSIASPDFREHSDWLRTIALGTVAGALLHFGDEPWGTYLPVFVVWQAVVAASVAYGLVIPPPKRN